MTKERRKMKKKAVLFVAAAAAVVVLGVIGAISNGEKDTAAADM